MSVFIALFNAHLCTRITFQKIAEGGRDRHKALISYAFFLSYANFFLCLSSIFLCCSEHFSWFVLNSNISFIEQQLWCQTKSPVILTVGLDCSSESWLCVRLYFGTKCSL